MSSPNAGPVLRLEICMQCLSLYHNLVPSRVHRLIKDPESVAITCLYLSVVTDGRGGGSNSRTRNGFPPATQRTVERVCALSPASSRADWSSDRFRKSIRFPEHEYPTLNLRRLFVCVYLCWLIPHHGNRLDLPSRICCACWRCSYQPGLVAVCCGPGCCVVGAQLIQDEYILHSRWKLTCLQRSPNYGRFSKRMRIRTSNWLRSMLFLTILPRISHC